MDKIKFLLQTGEKLFNERASLLTMWQIIAENFYPERADFTAARNMGEEYASNLMSSYPVLIRRDLGDSLSSMLRPTNKEWFHHRVIGQKDIDHDSKLWLEHADAIQRRLMYKKTSNLQRAFKSGDHDFATFGQTVLQVTLNKLANGVLYRNWHLRDCAWIEDENGDVTAMFRKWQCPAHLMVRLFGDRVHEKVRKAADKSMFDKFEVWHVELPVDMMHGDRPRNRNLSHFSFYLDVTHKHIMEEVPIREMSYIVPRWRTISGSPYAVSPATCVALPDARLLQAMAGVLLEAGEKAVNPPMVANHEVFGNFAIYAGGVTWADMADGRIGDHFDVLSPDKSGIPLGLEMIQDTRATLAEAFYINKLQLPPAGAANMTAYEAGQRVQEYIRQAMPLFEPMEYEYNAPVCEKTFNLLLANGAFGSVQDIPGQLRGAETEFTFESPLHDAIEREKGQQFLEAKSMLAEAVAIDPTAVYTMDIQKAFRDAMEGVGVPMSWMRSTDEAKAMTEAAAQAAEQEQMLANLEQSANIAQTVAQTPEIQ